MKYDISEIVSNTVVSATEWLKDEGLNCSDTEFICVQPLNDTQAVLVEVNGVDDDRTIKVKVSDTTLILPKLDGTIF